MNNPRLRFRAEKVRHGLDEVEARLRAALSVDAAGYEIQLKAKNKLTEELKQLEEQIGRLTIRAPIDGVVVNLHQAELKAPASQHNLVEFPDPDAVAEPSRWEGTTVVAGTGLLGVAATGGFVLETFVYEYDLSYLSPGLDMVCMLLSHPSHEFKSRIRSMTPVDVKTIENVGITLADVGYIPVKSSLGGQKEPLVTLYLLRSELERAAGQLPWGLTGKARITYGRGSMGNFYFERIVRALRLRLQRV
jgi:hypothetical protein